MSNSGSNVLYLGVYKFKNGIYVPINSFENNIKIDSNTMSSLIIEIENIDNKNYLIPFCNDLYKTMFIFNNKVVFIMIAQSIYPNRCMNAALKEIMTYYSSKNLTIDYLRTLTLKYDNFETIDKIFELQKKVEIVTITMNQNIDSALLNCVKLESIETQSQDLMQSAGIFRDRTRQLRNKMWWRRMKMYIIVGSFILVLLAIFVTVVVITIKS